MFCCLLVFFCNEVHVQLLRYQRNIITLRLLTNSIAIAICLIATAERLLFSKYPNISVVQFSKVVFLSYVILFLLTARMFFLILCILHFSDCLLTVSEPSLYRRPQNRLCLSVRVFLTREKE